MIIYQYNREIGYKSNPIERQKTFAEKQTEKESSELWQKAFEGYWQKNFKESYENDMIQLMVLGKNAEDFADEAIGFENENRTK